MRVTKKRSWWPLLAIIYIASLFPASNIVKVGAKNSICSTEDDEACQVHDDYENGTSNFDESSAEGEEEYYIGDVTTLLNNLIDYVNQNGGEVSSMQSFENSGSFRDHRVIATENIPKGTILVSVPWEMVINDETFPENTLSGFFCRVIHNLDRALESNQDDPYIQYLKFYLGHEGSGYAQYQYLPEFFTSKGKKWLADVTGVNLPLDLFTDDFKHGIEAEMRENCSEETFDVAGLFNTKSLFAHMLPLLDLYQHHNGEDFVNTANFGYKGQNIGIKASRDIAAGEQIYVTLNKCEYCGKKNDPNKRFTPQLARDAGFVEPYPQSWSIANKLNVEIHEDTKGKHIVKWMDDARPSYNDISFLMEEKYRLEQMSGDIHNRESKSAGVVKHEWTFIQNYHTALTNLVTAILDDVDTTITVEDSEGENELDDAYVMHEDETHFREQRQTCREWFHAFRNDHVSFNEGVKQSHYQGIWFYENTKSNDKCLELDDVVQICASYRPFYHEPFVHLPAALLPSMKRVVFVGGGDSMLLHEVLKYPDIELVVGLELDQVVVRSSFKYFYTQPHFDDERVEWWFGDATKSLNVLPKEYFGSFDLVMIDLSETVMSLTVTDQLDMVQALSLLTKPDGIFVKNEHYFKTLSKYFDYTAEVYLENNPIICDQHFALGSNRIDFLHPDFDRYKKYGVKTLLYDPLNDIHSHHDMFVQYSKNNAQEQGQCEGDLDKNSYNLVKAGVLMILEAEQTNIKSKDSNDILTSIVKALRDLGLSPLSFESYATQNNGNLQIVLMREGYVTLRSWPSHSYVGFDIQLWSLFDKTNEIKQSLLQVVESDDWSSYRIVVTGMQGTTSWENDKLKVGPKIVSTRDCEDSKTVQVHYKSTLDMLLEESISLFQHEVSLVVVLCGEAECSSASVLERDDINFVKISTCGDGSSKSDKYSLCENNLEKLLEKITQEFDKKIHGFLVDPSTPANVCNNFAKVLSRKYYQRSLFEKSFVTLVPIPEKPDDSREDMLYTAALKQYTRPLIVEVSIGNKFERQDNLKALFMAVGETGFYSELIPVVDKVKARSGLEAAITNMKGKHITFQSDYEAKNYELSHYNYAPGIDHYNKQLCLGYQSVFQFGKSNDDDGSTNLKKLSITEIVDAFEYALKKFKPEPPKIQSEDIGDGALVYTVFDQGHSVLVWDGNDRIDISVFTYETKENHEQLDNWHKQDVAIPFSTKMDGLTLLLIDEQPRGANHVINLADDIGYQKVGCYDIYDQCSEFFADGLCVEGGNYYNWMKQNCPMSCHLC